MPLLQNKSTVHAAATLDTLDLEWGDRRIHRWRPEVTPNLQSHQDPRHVEFPPPIPRTSAVAQSGHHRLDHLPVDVGEPIIAALEFVGEALVIDTHETHHGGL